LSELKIIAETNTSPDESQSESKLFKANQSYSKRIKAIQSESKRIQSESKRIQSEQDEHRGNVCDPYEESDG
jgi:hypothetical protein